MSKGLVYYKMKATKVMNKDYNGLSPLLRYSYPGNRIAVVLDQSHRVFELWYFSNLSDLEGFVEEYNRSPLVEGAVAEECPNP